MISTLSASNQQFLSGINQLQAQLTKVQAEISSGLKVTQASDAPDQVSPILQLHANIQRNQQIQSSLTQAQGEVTTADQALASGITLLDQVQSLATQGLGLSQTADTRTTLGQQIEDWMKQMVSLSQTAVNGKYIFSGDNDQSPSYQFNPNANTGVDRLQVSTATRQVEDAAGGAFTIALSANQIFDARDSSDNPTSGNVFTAMNAVRTALLSNDTTKLQSALSDVRSASTYLNQQQAFYGSVETRVSTALDQSSATDVAYRQDLSSRQDADETTAILEMQQYTTNLQAAMASEAKMPHSTLFDLMS
jgi:flagellar hook-associated protein 3 FlgL